MRAKLQSIVHHYRRTEARFGMPKAPMSEFAVVMGTLIAFLGYLFITAYWDRSNPGDTAALAAIFLLGVIMLAAGCIGLRRKRMRRLPPDKSS